MSRIGKLLGIVKKEANCRYVEVGGYRYAVGMDYILELAKRYNQKHNTDEGIDVVLTKCFGNTKMTPDALENMAMGIELSLNVYQRAAGREEYPEGVFKRIVEDKGFGYIGKVVYAIASTLTVMLTAGAEASAGEGDKEEKKSTQ